MENYPVDQSKPPKRMTEEYGYFKELHTPISVCFQRKLAGSLIWILALSLTLQVIPEWTQPIHNPSL